MENSQVEVINNEINRELANAEVGRALLATTFKGLTAVSMKQAIMEGMIRGFKFKDFLEKNVYAIPYGQGYSLVTSIDYARKRGMRAGIVGKDAPVYVSDAKKIVSCSVTVKRRDASGYIGEYTAEVYFDEYSTGKNLWTNKPRTMIAKVAEMHALRMACPEELSQVYTEEEMQAEAAKNHEPMPPYKVERIIPAEEDDSQGQRTQRPIEEEIAEEKPTDVPAPVDPKALKVEIRKLLKQKAGFTMLGKSQDAIELKVMAITGIKYSEENYKAIIEELKSL